MPMTRTKFWIAFLSQRAPVVSVSVLPKAGNTDLDTTEPRHSSLCVNPTVGLVHARNALQAGNQGDKQPDGQ